MKRVLLSTIFLAALMIAPAIMATDAAVVQGGWSRKDYRSSNTAGRLAAIESMPAVSVENGVMLMSFPTDLSDLKVSVATLKGAIVYETMVSAGSGITVPVRPGLQSGSYVLLLSHPKVGAVMDKLNVR